MVARELCRTSMGKVLAALGLTADIVVPDLLPIFQWRTWTQHYSTKDAGYGKQYTAV